MDSVWQDARLGVRTLLKAPVFTVAVVLTLGLGIGANAAVFTIVNRLLLKPLPVRDAAGLYVLAVQHEGNHDPHNVSWLDYQDYRDKSGAFEELAAYDVNFVGLSTSNRAERITVSYVTSNYFSMLGVPPALGRVLQPGDAAVPGADPIVILTPTGRSGSTVTRRSSAAPSSSTASRSPWPASSRLVRRRLRARRVRRLPAALDAGKRTTIKTARRSGTSIRCMSSAG